MKKVLLMLSVIGVFTFASCSKGMGGSAPEEVGCVLNSMVHSSEFGNDKTYYTYNHNHQISRVDYSGDIRNSFHEFIYYKKTITSYEREADAPLAPPKELNYQLDEKGRIIIVTDNLLDITNYFSYNAEGFLAEERIAFSYKPSIHSPRIIKKFSYTNGNLTKVVLYDVIDNHSIPRNTSIIYYNTDKLKNNIIFLRTYPYYLFSNIDMSTLSTFLGKKSKNIPSKIVYQDNPNINRTITTQYTYQKDAQENIISMRVLTKIFPFSQFDIEPEEYKFSYQCN